jgi:hypothetical protein
MFQTVIAVLIGMSFLYFILAVLCSGIKEFIAGIFNLRATTLEAAIGRMLDGATKNSATPLKDSFFAHPLISDLAKTDNKKPSYIPAEYFSGVLEAVLRAKSIGSADFPALVKDLPPGDLKDKLSALALHAGNDVTALRKQVEDWFNNTMDRVSGWYKRKAQIIMFFAAFGLVIAVNADTVAVSRTLWQNPAVRDKVVDAAQNALRTGNPGSATAGTDDAGRQKVVADAQKDLKNLANINQFPIGWSKAETQVSGGEWLIRICGWLLSAFAATLGAPFWFDAMSKLINMRASGAPPQKAEAAAAPAATVVVQTEAVKTKAAGAGA